MKNVSFAAIAYSIMWIAVSVAVCIGIYYTKSAKCLIAFLIPAMKELNISTNKSEEENKDEEI